MDLYYVFFILHGMFKSTILCGRTLLRARKPKTQNQTYPHLMSDFGGFVMEFDLTPYHFDNLTLLLQHLTLLFLGSYYFDQTHCL